MSAIHSSKFLSLILRHDPSKVGITLDAAGWTEVEALLAACAAHGHPLTRSQLTELVASSDKQRFALSADGSKIRANQGHSVGVELGLPTATPPARLYHGTVSDALSGIRAEGLLKRARHHVHLSSDLSTATKVGSRRGSPILLTVRADEMAAAGHLFYRSENGVWLTDQVPPQFIDFPATRDGFYDGARGARVQVAQATMAACEARRYTTPAGEVSLSPALDRAVAGTKLYERAPALPALATPRPAGVAKAGKVASVAIRVTAETTLEALIRLDAELTAKAGDVADGASAGDGAPASDGAPAAPHLGCLNFASAKNPGGGFLGGAQAQEEALARASALYPALVGRPEYYERNRANRSALYLDLALYSPRVPFFRDDAGGWLPRPVLASVITSPAPNASALRQHNEFNEAELRRTFERRARVVLAIAAAEGITHLVLGAWGAGVFGNDPAMVAEVFAGALDELGGHFQEVTFAIPPGPNHAPFASRFWRHTRPTGG